MVVDAHWNFRTPDMGDCYLHYKAITPSDTVNMDLTRAIWVGKGGDVAVVPVDGTAVLFKSVPDGSLLKVRAQRVNATSTTADDMVALY